MGYCPPQKRVLANKRTIEHVVREDAKVLQPIGVLAQAMLDKGVPAADVRRWAESERTRRRLTSSEIRETRTQRVGVHLEA